MFLPYHWQLETIYSLKSALFFPCRCKIYDYSNLFFKPFPESFHQQKFCNSENNQMPFVICATLMKDWILCHQSNKFCYDSISCAHHFATKCIEPESNPRTSTALYFKHHIAFRSISLPGSNEVTCITCLTSTWNFEASFCLAASTQIDLKEDRYIVRKEKCYLFIFH